MNDLTLAYSNDHISSKHPKPNYKITLNDVIKTIKNVDYNHRHYNYLRIKNTFRSLMNAGESVANTKKAIAKDKNSLHFFLLSGYCERGHLKADVQYNGCIQIDIDLKYANAENDVLRIKKILSKLDCTVFAASSITSGVKVLIRTDNEDARYHNDIAKIFMAEQLKPILKDFPKIQYDTMAYNMPCFVPCDKDVYFDENYKVYNTGKAKQTIDIERKEKNKKIELQTINLSIEDEKLNNQVCKYSFKSAENIGSGFSGTHQAIRHYAALLVGFGVDCGFAWNWLKNNGVQVGCNYNHFSAFYVNFKDFGANRESFKNKTIQAQADHIINYIEAKAIEKKCRIAEKRGNMLKIKHGSQLFLSNFAKHYCKKTAYTIGDNILTVTL